MRACKPAIMEHLNVFGEHWSISHHSPLMLIVQKVTMVAYALHDGKWEQPLMLLCVLHGSRCSVDDVMMTS